MEGMVVGAIQLSCWPPGKETEKEMEEMETRNLLAVNTLVGGGQWMRDKTRRIHYRVKGYG